jgi:hypothetical protein
VRDELRKGCGAAANAGAVTLTPIADIPVAATGYKGSHKVNGTTAADGTWLDMPMYQIDALVRRAPSLQKTREGRTPAATY